MPKTRKKINKKLWVVVSLLTAALIVVVILELTNTVYWFRHKPVTRVQTNTTAPSTINKATNNASPPVANQDSSSQGLNTGSSKGSSSPAAPTSTTPPTTPYGNFVSSHSPGQNTNEQSVCNTTPGVNCQISFTNGSVTKSLPTATTNSNGAAFWTWTPSTVGLTKGEWKVAATATNSNGGQSVSSNDSMALEVQ